MRLVLQFTLLSVITMEVMELKRFIAVSDVMNYSAFIGVAIIHNTVRHAKETAQMSNWYTSGLAVLLDITNTGLFLHLYQSTSSDLVSVHAGIEARGTL